MDGWMYDALGRWSGAEVANIATNPREHLISKFLYVQHVLQIAILSNDYISSKNKWI